MSVIVEQPRGHLSLRFMSPSTLLSLPFGFPDWMPVFQAMFLGLLTLVQELSLIHI